MSNDEVCVKDGLITLRSRNKMPEYIYIDVVAKAVNVIVLTIFRPDIMRGHEAPYKLLGIRQIFFALTFAVSLVIKTLRRFAVPL